MARHNNKNPLDKSTIDDLTNEANFDQEKDTLLWLIVVETLGLASRKAYSSPSKAFEMIEKCDEVWGYLSKLNFDIYSNLRDAVINHTITLKIPSSLRETDQDGIQEKVKESIRDLIQGAEIIENFKPNPKHVPDIMVKINNIVRPVEIKKEMATSSAVRQILRYIDFYKADKGYLIAPSLSDTIDLPENVIFIPFDINQNQSS